MEGAGVAPVALLPNDSELGIAANADGAMPASAEPFNVTPALVEEKPIAALNGDPETMFPGETKLAFT